MQVSALDRLMPVTINNVPAIVEIPQLPVLVGVAETTVMPVASDGNWSINAAPVTADGPALFATTE